VELGVGRDGEKLLVMKGRGGRETDKTPRGT